MKKYVYSFEEFPDCKMQEKIVHYLAGISASFLQNMMYVSLGSNKFSADFVGWN
jgi:hypothetical protein